MPPDPRSPAAIDAETLRLQGDWRLPHLAELDAELARLDAGDCRAVDAGGIEHLDASGAALLRDWLERYGLADQDPGLAAALQPLYETITEARERARAAPARSESAWREQLERIGRATVDLGRDALALTGFFGLFGHYGLGHF